jgi:hypothetical protein
LAIASQLSSIFFRMSSGVRWTVTPCLVLSSTSAAASSRFRRFCERSVASIAAACMIACRSGESDFQTSPLMRISSSERSCSDCV